jgi:phosphoglycolate phosphatase-like HAD superfamily hydrolase
MATPANDLRLVLWDIDHTLIETRGVGSQLTAAAFAAVSGRPLEHQVDPTGRTEMAIMRETLERNGCEPSDEMISRYAAELVRQYESQAELLRTEGRALPGAHTALAALAAQPHLVQTVLTGNLRGVAMTKLRVFGLEAYIDFEVGAYGQDDTERAKLVPVAQTRAGERYGARFNRDNTLIIGDTTSDVEAARRGGARMVGVASGRDREEELWDAGAEAVLPDLTYTVQLVTAISG